MQGNTTKEALIHVYWHAGQLTELHFLGINISKKTYFLGRESWLTDQWHNSFVTTPKNKIGNKFY